MPNPPLSAQGARVGDVMNVFDAREWGGRDVDDNSQFFHPATILELSTTCRDEQVATVQFHHDARVSRGHFVWGMEPSS